VFEWLTLSNIGSVASMLGIGLSLYVVYNVREIRKSYLFYSEGSGFAQEPPYALFEHK